MKFEPSLDDGDQKVSPICACCGQTVSPDLVEDDVISPSCFEAIRTNDVSWNKVAAVKGRSSVTSR